MGTQQRRERERSELRQRILDAALAIIAADGYAGLSMRKLAERIEYSAAAIYLHFENREQIAQALCEAGFAHLLDELATAGAKKTGAAALRALSQTYVAFGLRHPQLYRLIFMGDSEYMAAAYASQQAENAPARAYQALLTVAQELKASGAVRADLERIAIAEFIWTTLHGIVSLRITCGAFLTTDTDALVALATEATLRGLQ